jgi:hypothetical protein
MTAMSGLSANRFGIFLASAIPQFQVRPRTPLPLLAGRINRRRVVAVRLPQSCVHGHQGRAIAQEVSVGLLLKMSFPEARYDRNGVTPVPISIISFIDGAQLANKWPDVPDCLTL